MRREKPGFFNALNLASLKAGRPAVLEAPVECGHFRSGEEYFERWAQWYQQLDDSKLPKAEVKKKAEKKGLSVPDAFAGLLVFDALCLAAVKHMFPASPFDSLAAFADSLPSSTFLGKHNAAAAFFDEQGPPSSR